MCACVRGNFPRAVEDNVLDFNIVESEIELQSLNYRHFQTNGMNALILPAMSRFVPFQFFYKDGFDII